jgi:hypothetical protein
MSTLTPVRERSLARHEVVVLAAPEGDARVDLSALDHEPVEALRPRRDHPRLREARAVPAAPREDLARDAQVQRAPRRREPEHVRRRAGHLDRLAALDRVDAARDRGMLLVAEPRDERLVSEERERRRRRNPSREDGDLRAARRPGWRRRTLGRKRGRRAHERGGDRHQQDVSAHPSLPRRFDRTRSAWNTRGACGCKSLRHTET